MSDLRLVPGCGRASGYPLEPHVTALAWAEHCDACLALVRDAVLEEVAEAASDRYAMTGLGMNKELIRALKGSPR